MRKDFRKALAEEILLADGAIGTLLVSRGASPEQATKLGGTIKEGELGTVVQYWQFSFTDGDQTVKLEKPRSRSVGQLNQAVSTTAKPAAANPIARQRRQARDNPAINSRSASGCKQRKRRISASPHIRAPR